MAEAGREIFDGFPELVKIAFYTAATIAVTVFALGTALRIRRYMGSRKASRADRLLSRIWRATKDITLMGSRIRKDDPYAGLAHDLLLWGFGILFIGTVVLTIEEDLAKPLGTSFLRGTSYLLYSLVLDISGLLFLAGVLMMCYRRLRKRPSRLSYSERETGIEGKIHGFIMGDWAFLVLLLLVGVTGFVVEGARIYAAGRSLGDDWSPAGQGVALLIGFLGGTPEASMAIHLTSWWLHAAVALLFIAYIPFSKAFHLFTGFASLVFHDEKAAVRLEPPASVEPSTFSQKSDFTWVQLLQLDACTRCGRCTERCPAYLSGLSLSPRGLILALKEHVATMRDDGGTSFIGSVLPAEASWYCTTCMACMETCPVGVEHIPLIVEMRRYLVLEGTMDAGIQAALTSLSRYGNSFRKPERARAEWVKSMEVPVKDARREAVEYLWFVGDYASLDPRLQDVSAKVARVFHRAGLDFGILYHSERNSGNDVRRAGEEGLFEVLRDENLEALRRCQFVSVVTTDPHTYNTLKNEYPEEFEGGVYHYTELLDNLLQSGKLQPSRKLSRRVTYHDPCYLGRYNGIYDPPRRVLRSLGAELVEMPRSRERALCCGAGGGRIWVEAEEVEERPAWLRVKEAASLDGVDTLVVACPKDYVMFQDAVKTAGLQGTLEVKDLIELVEEAL
jgi:Fe-S oxidoreductase/nitrate reductase gamma subunit